MQRIVVTGATGFLGRAVCLRLRDRYHVIALGRNPALGASLAAEGVEFQACDLNDKTRLESLLAGADAIVHSAARSSPWGRYADFWRDNVVGTQNVLEASRKHGLSRIVHISSPSIYFELKDKIGIKESDPIPLKQLNTYALSKLEGEKFVNEAFTKHQLPVVTLRPQAIFGPGDTAILPRLIEVNQKSGMPVFKGRSPILDVTYVDNCAYAIDLALTGPAHILGKHYNITNDEPIELIPFLDELFPNLGFPLRRKYLPFPLVYTLAQVLEAVHGTFLPDKEPILTKYKVGVLSNSRTLDISAAKSDLGYKPLVSVAEGTERFIAWWNNKR